jgi:hypothetical protein
MNKVIFDNQLLIFDNNGFLLRVESAPFRFEKPTFMKEREETMEWYIDDIAYKNYVEKCRREKSQKRIQQNISRLANK